jgi:hypothetical protein
MLANAALFVFGTRRRVSELPVMSCIIGKFGSSTLLRIEVSESEDELCIPYWHDGE